MADTSGGRPVHRHRVCRRGASTRRRDGLGGATARILRRAHDRQFGPSRKDGLRRPPRYGEQFGRRGPEAEGEDSERGDGCARLRIRQPTPTMGRRFLGEDVDAFNGRWGSRTARHRSVSQIRFAMHRTRYVSQMTRWPVPVGDGGRGGRAGRSEPPPFSPHGVSLGHDGNSRWARSEGLSPFRKWRPDV
jgi:hypothetical protein